jgi:hypothetical protein
MTMRFEMSQDRHNSPRWSAECWDSLPSQHPSKPQYLWMTRR